MQPVSSSVNAPASRATGATATRSSGTSSMAEGLREAQPLRITRQDWNPQRNQQTADTQRTLDYLERMTAQLQQLKSTLSAQLISQRATAGSNNGTTSALDRQLQSLDDLWRQRDPMTGSSLDSQLRFNIAAPATRHFSVRGLDSSTLATGERETLTFSIGQGRQSTASITLEAGASLQDNVRKLDRALAPMGVGVSLNGAGETIFSVAETAWTQVRDTLAIKGGGIRLPAGQAHRAKAEAQEEALTPAAWGTGDAAALRSTLQEVTQALEHVRRVAQQVREALERAKQSTVRAADAAWAATFAEEFGARAQAPDYEVYAAVAPALVSVNRSRVMSLLSLK
ncbi:hypothetical protein V4F39_16890 [Aquincola sp. MAHUQ-54]|uniref:Uncharacterized protein n=1 Tax=Aquincola agrisoli TaxID=3119538 RepID=A0AAW9QGT4_9BURK